MAGAMDADKLVQQLAAGFETLQSEYQKLYGQHLSLERKLATAREQYNELAKLCGSGAVATPPLSLASSPRTQKLVPTEPLAVADVIERAAGDDGGAHAARTVRAAVIAAQTLRQDLPRPLRTSSEGVKIWAGPAADRPEPASSLMPSISESPLEQDFTIEGRPSKLGCPFASMANKRLSSHAASVLSRYNTRDSVTGAVPSTPLSSVSRVNGRESMSRRGSRRPSMVDPIKAEICGMSNHKEHREDDHESPFSERATAAEAHELPHVETHEVENAEVGVCPIRFLDQHSPEEVATYFEKHKHELPRSHEVCVRRYQSNEQQIQELDAKYGNLVSMIQGLGARHKEMLPDEPADADQDGEEAVQDAKSAEKVRKWASSVSAQAPAADTYPVVDPEGQAAEEEEERDEEGGGGERLPHFDRPLREIRVGESPSRPWGLTVPAKYLEETRSEGSSRPAQISSPAPQVAAPLKDEQSAPRQQEQQQKGRQAGGGGGEAARCPFGFNQQKPSAAPPSAHAVAEPEKVLRDAAPERKQSHRTAEHTNAKTVPTSQQPAFLATTPDAGAAKEQPRMVFTGPVFIGYSAEDAAKILRESGMGRTGQ